MTYLLNIEYDKGVKEIVFTHHAVMQLKNRNATMEEVCDTINHSEWVLEKEERMSARKVFRFGREHFGRYYSSKVVVPIFKEEGGIIVVITVYTFFQKKGDIE